MFGPTNYRAMVLSDRATALINHLIATEKFRTREVKFDAPATVEEYIELTLRDGMVNDDHSSLGMQTWGSAAALMEMIAKRPDNFFPRVMPTPRTLRILELGAGTGLVSLGLARLIMGLPDTEWKLKVEIIATDFHPDVLQNLEDNVSYNLLRSSDARISVHVHKLDWEEYDDPDMDQSKLPAPFNQPFDIIIGADVIYDSRHASWIYATVSTLLRKHSPYPEDRRWEVEPTFWLIVPLRHTHKKETSTIDEVFPRLKHVRWDRRVLQLGASSMKEVDMAVIARRTPGVTYRLYEMRWKVEPNPIFIGPQ